MCVGGADNAGSIHKWAITGTISDQAGAVISNAAVTVTNEGTGAQRRVKANENGLYVAPELPVGFYSLKVEGGSFTPATGTRVKVDVGSETRVDVTLTPHATESARDVPATAPLVQPDNSALAEVIDNKQVDALPINGRDYRRNPSALQHAACCDSDLGSPHPRTYITGERLCPRSRSARLFAL